MPHLFRLIPVLALAALLPACATITTGTTQNVTVVTEPAGAACTLSREGATVAMVNPTPGTAIISRSHRDIAVSCSMAGRQNATATLTSQLQAMTAGNVLIGGVIGIAVDAASGASARYPENIALTLPAAGPTPAELEAARQAEIRRSFDARIEATRATCRGAACARQIRALEIERDQALASTPRSV